MKHRALTQRLKRWLRFVLGGGLNTAFTYGIYLSLNLLMSYQWAYLIAYAIGVVFAYWFNTVIVFKVPLSWKAFFSYPLVYVIQYGASALLLSALVEVWGMSEVFAPLVVTVGMVPLTYVLSKRLLKADSGAGERMADELKNGQNFNMIDHLMQSRRHNTLIRIFIFAPILSLLMNGLAWLRFGIDFPYWDDWLYYSEGHLGSLDLSYLFKPANDTLYPVGKALDSIAYRYLNGNTVAYQFISMISVLGLLLGLQWRLLMLALNDRLLAASAFSLTLFMLQPDTYWGSQNLAYHQAIPLVCSLAAIYVVLRGHWNSRWAIPALLILGLFSGLSYISGAFAMLGLGVVFLAANKWIEPAGRRPLWIGGWSLLAVGVVTSLAQIWVIAVVQKGVHLAEVPMAWPIESDFWFYMLGKVARSLMLPMRHPVFSLALTFGILIFIFNLIFGCISRLIKNKTHALEEARPALVFIALFVVVFLYLSLVSAGRANLHPPEVNTSVQIFSYGFYRFHFFWVTLLWPWVAALSLLALKKRDVIGIAGLTLKTALIMPLAVIVLIVWAGGLNHSKSFKNTMERQAEGVQCLINELQKGKGIFCPQMYPAPLDSAFFYAKETGASFARIIPVSPIPMGSDAPAPVFRMAKDWQAGEIKNADVASLTAEGLKLKAGVDPMISFKTGALEKLAGCAMLEVAVSMHVSESDSAQLFFKTTGQTGFTEAASRTSPVDAGGGFKSVFFTLNSQTGFADEFRFDPVTKPQSFELKALEVRCRRSKS